MQVSSGRHWDRGGKAPERTSYADSCNVTFLATFLCYTLVGMLRFLMFNGREPGIEEELTENLIIDGRLYHTWFSKLPSFVLGAVVITQMSRCELQLAGRPCFSSPCNCFVTANLLTNGSQHLIVDGLILNPVALRLEKIFLGHDDAVTLRRTRMALRLSLAGCCSICAIAMPHISIVMAIIGAFTCSVQAISFPCMAYLKLMSREASIIEYTVSWFLSVVGIITSVVCTEGVLRRIQTGE